MNMKKRIYLIPILGIMFSCSGEKKETQKTPELLQTDTIETQDINDSINPSDYEMDQAQSELDSLLNNI